MEQAKKRPSARNRVGAPAAVLATWLATLVAAGGCRTRDEACATSCQPACPSGWVCAAELGSDISTTWEGVCLQPCAHPSDCPAGLSCRDFSSGGFLCASDSVPSFCPVVSTWTTSLVGYGAYCVDDGTAAVPFASSVNGTSGWQMQTCANGCVDHGICAGTKPLAR